MDCLVTYDWFENNIRLVYMYGDPQEIIPGSIISVHSPDKSGKACKGAGKSVISILVAVY